MCRMCDYYKTKYNYKYCPECGKNIENGVSKYFSEDTFKRSSPIEFINDYCKGKR